MIAYIIQVVLFQVLFLAVYNFFLSKETFHNYNRWYLLGTPIVSFVLPLIKIPTFQKAVPEELMVYLPEILLSPQKIFEETTYYSESSIDYINLVFIFGVILFTIVFLVKLYKIFRLISVNETIQKTFYKLVLLPQQTTAFSFFNFIFLGKNISKEKQADIIEHELVHSKQKHSLDLLFYEFLRVAMWFNPMIYIYQQRITLLHEYISDAEVVKTTEKHDYFNKLLSQTFQVENISFVNQFYKHSLIKKRITMMTKNKSKQIKKAKYLLLLPLLASMLLYTSCGVQKNTSSVVEVENIEKVVLAEEVLLDNVPFAIIEEVPTFTGCTGTRKEKSDCLNMSLKKHVVRNFNSGLASKLGLTPGKKKIWIVFRIDEKGNVTNVNARAPHPKLKEEAIRVVNTIPRMIAGKHKGKAVGMKYTLPITFYVEGVGTDVVTDKITALKEIVLLRKGINGNADVPFSIIENVPVFPGCTGTRAEKAACLNENIKKFVVRNFNGKLPKKLRLSKGIKKIWVVFSIDEKGNVTNINARAPHPKLKEEAIRVARLLPKMVPGMQRGKAVGMKYTLPITFNVAK
jgi:beta-lactamase regulating signal transducer with metallopeptidase domain